MDRCVAKLQNAVARKSLAEKVHPHFLCSRFVTRNNFQSRRYVGPKSRYYMLILLIITTTSLRNNYCMYPFVGRDKFFG